MLKGTWVVRVYVYIQKNIVQKKLCTEKHYIKSTVTVCGQVHAIVTQKKPLTDIFIESDPYSSISAAFIIIFY